MKNKIICILGMHRSGTSMTTRLLNICGLQLEMGDILIDKYSDNQKGYWENSTVIDINDEILSLFGGGVNKPPIFPKDWQSDKRLDDLYKEAQSFVDNMNQKNNVWGFKDPRTCLTLPFWQKLIPDMKYVIPVRFPQEVAMSLHKRDGTTLSEGLLLYLSYWNSVFKYTKPSDRCFTFFDNYFIDWKSELEEMLKCLDINDLSLKGNEKEIDDFISNKLRNNKVEKEINQEKISQEYITNLVLQSFSNNEVKKDEKFYIKEEQIKELQNNLQQQSQQLNQKEQTIQQKMQELNRANEKVKQKDAELQQKEQQLQTMKSSKFWITRNYYFNIKNKIIFTICSPNKFLNKYFFRKKKLIMTLLVRDEIDIIEENIKFHLAHGVDFIIATDNGSIDGTRDILKKYEDRGVLHLIDEPTQDYSQAIWVNRMGKIAYEKYKANYIFHCDADEFWYPKTGNLKNEIRNLDSDVIMVDIINILLYDKHGEEKFPYDAEYAVIKPIVAKNLEIDSKNKNLYLFKYPSKVIFKKLYNVVQGNHDIDNKQKNKKILAKNIVIYHYPVRSKKHFFTKVINGGKAYDQNVNLNKSIGWHWRRWYEAYNNDMLENEYKKLILHKDQINKLLKDEVIVKHKYNNIIK